ncbi:MAG: hypothetical protein HDR50_06365 [Desulfovibrio sp.]|uniref:hypothetical protein n=1 Tax=Desulfovibrio sp. TaxID=885 RepID=UPI001A6F7E07|nr:hypothetical protein [Desulfovibrio sp.]MBD5417273.1 hypothetical protein [Desulfovibrio sp.]
MDTIDFLVLAAHGTGIHAFHTYANMLPGISCLSHGISEKAIREFLRNPGHTAKGLILDTPALDEGFLDAILARCSPQCTLVVLSRDPLERLKSVVNTHVLWWAEATAGVFDRPGHATKLYGCADVKTMTETLLDAPNMNTSWKLLPLVAPRMHNFLVFDIRELYPENAERSLLSLLALLEKGKLPQGSIPGFSIPRSLVYRKENSFVRFIKKLRLRHGDAWFAIKPCPYEFCSSYGLEQDIVLLRDPADYGFSLGDYEGELAFVLCEYDHHSRTNAMNIVRQRLEQEPELLLDYCADISRRHAFAQKLADCVALTNDGLLDFARSDRQFGSALRQFFQNHEHCLTACGRDASSSWQATQDFSTALASILAAGAGATPGD